MSEVEEIMKRVSSHKGVTGAIIIDKEGTEMLFSDQFIQGAKSPHSVE